MRGEAFGGATRVFVAAVGLFCLPLLSGCAFFVGELVGVGAGATAGVLTESPAAGTAIGGVTGTGAGALAGLALGGPLAGAIGGGLSGASVGYLTGHTDKQ
jgi:hypothetical protein